MRAARLLLLLSLIGLLPSGQSQAADAKPRVDAANTEYPLAIVAVSSIDRLRERARQCADVAGRPESADGIFSALILEEELGELFQNEGFDPTRPVGFMSFFKSSGEANQAATDGEDDAPRSENEFPDIFDPNELLEALISEPVMFFPVRDANLFVPALAKLMDEPLIPTPGKPGYFQDDEGDQQPVRIVGKYVVICTDGIVDRQIPDIDGLCRPLLTGRDAVVSIQARGIPKPLRTLYGEAIKMAFGATLQRFDDESDLAFRWRTALGAFQLELLDIAVSHIEEINIGLKFDPAKVEAAFDMEIVGPKNGKLAQLCNGLSGKRSFFAELAGDDSPFNLEISTALSPRLTKPLVDALRMRPEFDVGWENHQDATAALGELFRTLANTIEAGHLDVAATSRGPAERRVNMLGLRVATNPQLVPAVQILLDQVGKLNVDQELQLGIDSIDDRPIHRLPPPFFYFRVDALVSDPFGVDSTLPKDTSLWITATPQSLWFAWANGDSATAPDELKDAIRSVNQPASRTAASAKAPAPVQMVLHTRDWPVSIAADDAALKSNNDEVRQAALKELDQRKQRGEVIQTAFRERPEAVRFEVRPSDTGLRMRMTVEEAYLTWFGQIMASRADAESE
jgi:hypothetical protein